MANRKKKKHKQARPSAAMTAQAMTGQNAGSKSNKQASRNRAFKESKVAVATQATTPAWLLWLLVFLIASPAIMGPYGQKGGYTPDLHMGAYIQVLATALLAITLFVLRKRVVELVRAPIVLPLSLLYFLALLSLFWAHSLHEAVATVLDYTGAFFVAVLVLLLVRDMEWIKKVIFAMVVSGMLIAILGILQFLFGVDWVQQHIVPAATFSNKNMAGQYGLLTFPLAVIAMFNSKKWQATWFYAVAAALIAVFMFFTRARAVWVGWSIELLFLFVYFLYLLVIKRYNFIDTIHKKLAVGGGLAVMLFVSYLSPTMLGNYEKVEKASLGAFSEPNYRVESGWELFSRVVGQAGDSGTGRIRIWFNSIPMFIDHFFFGVGSGNWTIHYAKYQAWLQQDGQLLNNQYHANAHNDYVELFCELGAVGTLLFFIAVFGLFRIMGALLFSRRLDPGVSLLFAALAAAVIGLAVDAFFSFPLKRPVQLMVLGVYMALFCVGYHIFIDTNKRMYRVTLVPQLRKTVATVVAVISMLLLVLHYNLFQSEYYFRVAAISLKKPGQERLVTRSAQKAYEHNPLRTKLIWYQAVAALKLGNIQRAIPLLERILAQYPYSQDTTLNLTSAYLALGMQQKAMEHYARLAEAQEVKPEVLIMYLRTLEHRGKYAQMIKEIDKAIPNYIDNRDVLKKHMFWYGVIPFRTDNVADYDRTIKLLRNIRQQAQARLAATPKEF